MNAPAHPDLTFHAGEVALQRAAGSREVLAEHGPRLMRDHMPDQHRQFFAQLPFVVVGGLDTQGQPWATLWSGPPGFMHSPDPQHLVLRPALRLPGDPLASQWHAGAPMALLGIEPHTRRRNRANGRLQAMYGGMYELHVRQSFGNCPKYIVPRRAEWQPAGPGRVEPSRAEPGRAEPNRAEPNRAESGRAEPYRAEPYRAWSDHTGPGMAGVALGPALDASAIDLIARSDTFFIASAAPGAADESAPTAAGVDVSHRAGPVGFVSARNVDGAIELTIPDFVGNRFFNTLGNLLLEPRAGLVFIDYARGDVLWLAGLARIDEDPVAVAAVPGAQRLLRIRVTSGFASQAALTLRWS